MTVTVLRDVPLVSHSEAMILARSNNDAIIRELQELQASDWEKPTDCIGWSVRDVVSHVLGWAEALTSVKEATKQTMEAVRRRKGFGNMVDAQNEVQVEARRWLATSELLVRLERALPRFLKVRDKGGKLFKRVPYLTGPTGWTNLGFLADHIFTRDLFMHRIDIARALGTELVVGPDERRVIEDCLHEWAATSGADMILEMTGPSAGTYVAGAGEAATLKGDSIDLCRYLAGRGSIEAFEISGDAERAKSWLDSGARF